MQTAQGRDHACIGKAFTAVGNFIKHNAMAILQIAINAALNVATGFACVPCVAAVSAAVVTGISGGGNLGQVLKAAAIAGVTTWAFQGIGPSPSLASVGTNPIGYGVYVAENAMVGCASSVASGGSCKSGALAAGVGAAISPLTRSVFQNPLHNTGDLIGGTIVQATAGGIASVAGGGKFANGAVTAGFQYLATTSLEIAVENSTKAGLGNPMDSMAAEYSHGRINLGEGYTGRYDPVPMGNGEPSSFEVHVFKGDVQTADTEVGVWGPEGWINKHGGIPEDSVPGLETRLRGISINEGRRMGVIDEKGQQDIKNVPLWTLFRNYLRVGPPAFILQSPYNSSVCNFSPTGGGCNKT